MKKSLLALAALGTFAGVAHAQSSVTLYGIVDAGFAYNNNSGGQKLYATSAGNLQGDRWGLRGTEDLGGGLKALFVLENGFQRVQPANWVKAATNSAVKLTLACRASSVRLPSVVNTTPWWTTPARSKWVASGRRSTLRTRATWTT